MDDKEISSCEDVHPTMPFNQLVSTRQTSNASNLVNTNNLEDISMQSKQGIQDDDSSGAANDNMVHDSPPKMPVYDNRNNEHNSIANNIVAEVKRPVALRPSSNPVMNRLHHLDAPNNSEIDILENLPTTAPPITRGNGPITNAPQLRIRPIHQVTTSKREEKNMPSPLLRRGAAERAYLQGQLKAEALQRRKQEQHNEDRKMRGRTSISPIDIDGLKDKDIPVNDGGIQSMIEKFKFGLGPPQNDNNQNSLLGFIPKRKNSRKDLRDFASSPPAILKKTFKRSVSAVLADSLGTSNQEEDGNLLYFPSGEQLQYEEQEDNTSALHDVQEDNGIEDEEDETRPEISQPIGGDDGSVSVSETPAIQSSPQSSCSDDELSPSLVGADVIWQQGTFTVDLPGECTMPNLVSKKITLRPKMKEAPQDNNIASSSTHSSQEFKPIDDCNNSDCLAITTGDPQPKMDCTQAIVANVPVRNINTVLDEDKIPLNYASPDKFDILASSESFQQLQLDNQVNRDRMGSEDRPDGVVHQDITSYVFSSPDAGFNHPTLKGRSSMMGYPQPLSEFNYKTPDNSENRRTRKSWEVMPKLPELGLPNMVIDVNKKQGLPEFNYTTPDNSENKRISKSREVMPKLLEVGMPDMMINATKEGEGALELELNNYRTPDHKKNVHRKQIKDQMPKLPEMPKISAGNIDRRLQQGEASMALDTTAEEETDFSSEFVSGLLLREPLSESNYRTPDHSLNSSSRLQQECERMPKLPELNSECKCPPSK